MARFFLILTLLGGLSACGTVGGFVDDSEAVGDAVSDALD